MGGQQAPEALLLGLFDQSEEPLSGQGLGEGGGEE